MSTKQELLILTAAAVVMFAIAPYAFADTNTNNGSNNVIQSGAGNTLVNGGVGAASTVDNTFKPTNIVAPVNIAEGGKGGKGGNAVAQTGPVDVSTPVNIGGTHVPRQAPSLGGNFGAVSGNVVSCTNSVGGGLVAPIGGFQVNGSDTDRNCQRILLSREIMRHGKHPGEYEDASVGLLCRDDELREEMAKAGTPCPADRRAAAAMSADAPALAYVEPAVNRNRYPSNTRNGW